MRYPVVAAVAWSLAWNAPEVQAQITPSELTRACTNIATRTFPGKPSNGELALLRVCAWRVPSTVRSAAWTDADFWVSIDTLQKNLSVILTEAYKETPSFSSLAAGSRGLRSMGAVSGASAAASNVLWGIADFVIQRAEEEARSVVQHEASKRICSESSWAWPQTCLLLNSDSIPGSFFGSAYRAGLATAARADLVQLPVRLVGTLPLEEPLRTVIGTAGLFVAEVADGRPPAEVLRRFEPLVRSSIVPNLAEKLSEALSVPDTLCAAKPAHLQLLRLIMSLTTADMTGGFESYVKTSLVNASSQLLGCASLSTLRTTRDSFAVRGVIVGAAQFLSAMDDAASALEDAQTVPASDSAAQRMRREAQVRVITATWRGLDGLITAIAGEGELLKLTHWLEGFRLVSLGIASQNAGQAMSGVLMLIDLVEADTALRSSLPAALSSHARQYFALAADLAQAQSPDEVTKSLEQFAAPRGTATSKRRQDGRFVAINAYLGMAAGGEWVEGGSAAAVFAPSLPIGVEWRFKRGRLGSLSTFVQVMDLGALASWRINDDDPDVGDQPEVGFAQVFSPGISLVYGPRGAPLSLGLGVAYTPALRSLTTATAQEDVGALRLSLSLAIDVPILVIAR